MGGVNFSMKRWALRLFPDCGLSDRRFPKIGLIPLQVVGHGTIAYINVDCCGKFFYFFGEVQRILVRCCLDFGHVHRFRSYSFGHLHSDMLTFLFTFYYIAYFLNNFWLELLSSSIFWSYLNRYYLVSYQDWVVTPTQ